MNNWALFLVDDDFNLVWSSLNSVYYWYDPKNNMRLDAQRRDGVSIHWNGMHCTYVYVELKE